VNQPEQVNRDLVKILIGPIKNSREVGSREAETNRILGRRKTGVVRRRTRRGKRLRTQKRRKKNTETGHRET